MHYQFSKIAYCIIWSLCDVLHQVNLGCQSFQLRGYLVPPPPPPLLSRDPGALRLITFPDTTWPSAAARRSASRRPNRRPPTLRSGPGLRRKPRRRRRRRRRWLRRRRRPAQPAMSLAAAGDAPRFVGALSNTRAHGGSRFGADCSRRRGGSHGGTAKGPPAARAVLRACARTRWSG